MYIILVSSWAVYLIHYTNDTTMVYMQQLMATSWQKGSLGQRAAVDCGAAGSIHAERLVIVFYM
jgi:hypothetical protein